MCMNYCRVGLANHVSLRLRTLCVRGHSCIRTDTHSYTRVCNIPRCAGIAFDPCRAQLLLSCGASLASMLATVARMAAPATGRATTPGARVTRGTYRMGRRASRRACNQRFVTVTRLFGVRYSSEDVSLASRLSDAHHIRSVQCSTSSTLNQRRS